MIRLGKDKVDERFNILEDGNIVDLNGNVQELTIAKGRSYFQSVAVHKIQMWTNYGWRDGHKWDIHHLDENKLNNSLSNLVYLTHSEHTVLHKKGAHWSLSEETCKKISNSLKGKHHSEETKAKMSAAKLGKKRSPFSEEHKAKISAAKLSKHLSTETRSRMRDAKIGLKWWNNGIKSIRAKECPKGFVAGRLKWK